MMKIELRTREDIEQSDQYRVEDAGKYSDAELVGLLKDIFGLTDTPGTVKKLKARELYFLAFGAAKKGVAFLPPMPPKPVAPPPLMARAGGAATGAAPTKDDDCYHPADEREEAELRRKSANSLNKPLPLDPYPPPDPEDVIPESEKRRRLAEKQPYEGKLRGETVPLKDMEVKQIDYKKRPDADRQKLRSEFNSTERTKFLKDTANDPGKVKQLKAAGLTDTDIAKMKDGEGPDLYQVHHKLPLDDGGTNSQDNLVLVKQEPYHKTLTNAQKQLTGTMKPGEVKTIAWPIPPGFIYPN